MANAGGSVLFCLGTLTQNEMVFKRLHLGTVSYGMDTMDEIQSHITQSYAQVRQSPSDGSVIGVLEWTIPLLQCGWENTRII